MRISKTRIYGFEPALEGARNSRESWERSDSWFLEYEDQIGETNIYNNIHGESTKEGLITIPLHSHSHIVPEYPTLGPNDLKLCCKLIKADSEHRKFLRQIVVWVKMELPRYIWTEMDTYHVFPTRLSVSTMDTLGKRDLKREDFQDKDVRRAVLDEINNMGLCYRSKKPYYWVSPVDGRRELLEGYDIIRKIKKMLPEGYILLSSMTFNYENLLNIYHQRKSHRLHEWREICSWIKSLPYMEEFIEAATPLKKKQLQENLTKLEEMICELRNDALQKRKDLWEVGERLNEIGLFIEDNLR